MSFLVAMAQMSPRLGDVRGNVERHLQIIEEARAKRADVLLFPELSLTGVALGDRAVDVSLTLDSPEFADVRRASKELAIGIGLIERTTDRLLRNSYLWLDGGTVLQLHRKVHLGETAAGHEASVLAPGRRFRAIDTRRGRVGILTGADARHLTAASVLALDGLDVLVAPLALPARPLEEPPPEAGPSVWGPAYASLLRCYVFVVNRVGVEEGVCFAGASRAYGPTGDLLAEGGDEGDELIVTTLDHEHLRRARVGETGPRDEARDVVLREMRRLARER
jgi:predicted amidohydrolase